MGRQAASNEPTASRGKVEGELCEKGSQREGRPYQINYYAMAKECLFFFFGLLLLYFLI